MNVHYQRYPRTEQFITAKISGNALKQQRRTHSVLRQPSSQLQKYKAARTSRRIRSYAAWMADAQGWQFETCTLHKNWECTWSAQENFRFFIMWLLYAQLLRRKNRHGLVWAIMINPP